MNLGRHKAVSIYRTCDTNGDCEGDNDESRLVVRLKRGDLKALGELFQNHKNLVFRTAFAITHDERAAEDICQECFVRLYTYADSVDQDRPLKPWLYRVTVNLAYDWSSSTKPTQPLDDVIEWLSGLPGSFPAPDREAEEAETTQIVQQLITELPAVHRAVIVLFYMENLTLEEIAQVLDLPVGTVKSRLHYARERLRSRLIQHQQLVPKMVYEYT